MRTKRLVQSVTGGLTQVLHDGTLSGDGTIGSPLHVIGTGLTSLNGLIAPSQTFAIDTAGTDFSINSLGSVHTFSLPDASAVNRGALTSADWTTFNDKIGGLGSINKVAYFDSTNTLSFNTLFHWNNVSVRLGLGTATPSATLDVAGIANALTQYNIGALFFGTQDNTNGNLRLGNLAGNVITVGSGQNNTLLGISAGSGITTGDRNTFVGRSTGTSITTQSDNTVMGHGAVALGAENVVIGSAARNTSGGISIGYQAGLVQSSAVEGSIFIGYQAGKAYTQPAGFPPLVSENTFIGYKAGMSNIQAYQDTYIGYLAGNLDVAAENTLVGARAGSLLNDVNAAGNTMLGSRTGINTNTGSYNTFIGSGSGFNNTSGINNVYIGSGSGSGNLTGSRNASLGYSVFTDGVSDSVTIGNGATSTVDHEITFGGGDDGAGNDFRLTALWFGQSKTTTIPFSKIGWHITPADAIANTQGTAWAFYDGAGTGSATSGGYEWYTHPAGGAGSATNAAVLTMALSTTGLDISGSLKVDSIVNDTGLAHGTYTPSLTNTTNVTASTARNCSYTRVGNIVTVFGSVDVTTTLAIATVLGISLPIASNLAAVGDLNGTAVASSAIATNAYLEAETTADTANLKFIGLSVGGAGTLYFSFSYSVI
jgi:hypothetical protein